MAIRPEASGRRPSIRLPEYDYGSAGAYFVTICADRRRMLFESPMIRGAVDEAWVALPHHFPSVTIDAFVVMPNHIHGIIMIAEADPAVAPRAEPPDPPSASKPTLGTIVRSFKSAATKRYRELTKRMNCGNPTITKGSSATKTNSSGFASTSFRIL
jgi:putative transposase